MSYTAADGRQQILDELARAIEETGIALVALGEAYERMDEQAGDRLEEELFRPVQSAYGRGQRTHTRFATQYGLPERAFPSPKPGLPTDPRRAIEHAAEALHIADETLATLQDSMLPVEVGDPELRAGLAGVRDLIAPLPARSRELVRTLGR
jgi:hypothetical protein